MWREAGRGMDFFSSDTLAKELQRPIFNSEENSGEFELWTWQQNIVLRPLMLSVCSSCFILMMILAPCLADTFSHLLVNCSIHLSVISRVTLSFSLSPCYFSLYSVRGRGILSPTTFQIFGCGVEENWYTVWQGIKCMTTESEKLIKKEKSGTYWITDINNNESGIKHNYFHLHM